MHCVAGDGVGILAGAVITSLFHLPKTTDIGLEYVLGFGFGWSVFQSLFMRDMAGGSYLRALSSTFFPELLSMNCLMAGMVPVMALGAASAPASRDPSGSAFWFIMSMALLVGFITAYPMNWWLVSRHMKHGMMTVRPQNESPDRGAHKSMHDNHTPSERPTDDDVKPVSNSALAWYRVRTGLGNRQQRTRSHTTASSGCARTYSATLHADIRGEVSAEACHTVRRQRQTGECRLNAYPSRRRRRSCRRRQLACRSVSSYRPGRDH